MMHAPMQPSFTFLQARPPLSCDIVTRLKPYGQGSSPPNVLRQTISGGAWVTQHQSKESGWTLDCERRSLPDLLPATHSSHSSETIGAAPRSPSSLSSPSSNNVVIRPRRRGGGPEEQDREPRPITITIEVLEKLYCKQLSVAAKTLGISVTALKKVCRTLGIRSWPYRFQDLITRPLPTPRSDNSDEDTNSKTSSSPAPPFQETAFSPPPHHGKDMVSQCQEGENAATQPPSKDSATDPEISLLLQLSKTMWADEEADKYKMAPLDESSHGWLVCPVDADAASTWWNITIDAVDPFV